MSFRTPLWILSLLKQLSLFLQDDYDSVFGDDYHYRGHDYPINILNEHYYQNHPHLKTCLYLL